MDNNFYEEVGRIYCAIVDLNRAAKSKGLYLSCGLDKDGEFYLRVSDDDDVSKAFYRTGIIRVCEDNIAQIREEVGTVKGFILGWAKAREIAAEAAQPEVEFGPLDEVKKEAE